MARNRRATAPVGSRAWVGMSEHDFMWALINAAKRLGYTCIHHETDSRKSPEGFPDLVICGRGRTFFWECKSDDPTSKPTKAQRRWLDELTAAGQDARVVRPAQLDDLYSELAGDWHVEGLDIRRSA